MQFCVWCPDAIRAQSVTQKAYQGEDRGEIKAGIYEPVTNDGGRMKYGGVNDPRMGGDEKLDPDDPGFFGHIELAQPVYNIGYINEVRTILGCVCYHCGKILEGAKNEKIQAALKIQDPKSRLRAIHAVTKGKKACNDESGCGRKQPVRIMKPSADVLMVQFERPSDNDPNSSIPGNGEPIQRLLPREALRILKSITDENIVKLGFHPKYARPEWFIWTVLPVPPPPTRPSVEFDSGITDDDLTHKYVNIVKANNLLRQSLDNGDPPTTQEDVRVLCFLVLPCALMSATLSSFYRVPASCLAVQLPDTPDLCVSNEYCARSLIPLNRAAARMRPMFQSVRPA